MSERSAEQILHDLEGILRNFRGREYVGVIDRRTRVFGDLGLASIEAIVLGETLDQRYARPFPFHQLLSELGQRQAEDLEVGELVDFLHAQLNHPGAEG
jgi:acyl carrier protein